MTEIFPVELFDHPLDVLQMGVNKVHFKARVKVLFRKTKKLWSEIPLN